MLIVPIYTCSLMYHEVFGLETLFTFFNFCDLKRDGLETLKIFQNRFPEK